MLRLGVVQDRLKDLDGNANEDQRFRAYAKALRSVLTEVIEHDDVSGKSRRLLYDVLPLNEAFRSMKIKERRVEASKHVKPGKKVKPGTVRTYHEPRALEKFAKVILQVESNFRAAYRDGKLVDSDEQDS
ncbi:MAG TPA: hypothetical protein VHY18_12015 [Solirubrobacteraceae bacterium]|nr:hypothetical protein [Solirubrobacteraceae bacterium]